MDRPTRIALVAAGLAALAAPPAFAGNPFASAWSCAKASAGGAANIGVDLARKAETIASMGAETGMCLAKSGPDQTGFALTMAAITAIKIASPSSLPNGQCKPRIHNQLARPFAEGISVVMPSGGVKNSLMALVNSDHAGDVLWEKFASLPPPVMTYASHVDCSCMLIDNGVALADLSAVGNAVADISDKCGTFLDDAGLGFINDYGSAAIAWTGEAYSASTGWWDRKILGQEQHASPDVVYQMYWGPHEVPRANQLLVGGPLEWRPQSNVMADQVVAAFKQPVVPSGWGIDPTKLAAAVGEAHRKCTSGADCHTSVAAIHSQCVTYYDERTASKAHAQQWCDAMRDQRFEPAAQKLAKEFGADIATRELVQERLDTLRKQTTKWLWRLPRRGGYQPGDPFNGWDMALAENVALAQIGHAQAFGKLSSRGPWDYQLSGVFAAARSVLPNVGWDPQKAADVAFEGVGPKIDANLRASWEQWDVFDRSTRLAEWLPAPAFGGQYGCPAGDGPATLGARCRTKVVEAYDKVCALPVVEAHVRAIDLVDLSGPGRRLDTVRDACLSWLKPVIARAVALADPMPELDALKTDVCGRLPTRSAEQQACQTQVDEAGARCAIETFDAGQGVEAARACIDRAGRALRVRAAQGQRVAPPDAGGIVAPGAGTRPPALSAPARGTAPAPRRAPVVRAPAAGDSAVPAPRPEPAPPTPAAARGGRPPPVAPATPACAEGEVSVVQADGTRACQPRRRGR